MSLDLAKPFPLRLAPVRLLASLLLILSLAVPTTAFASQCLSTAPGATLLYPYVALDFETPKSPSTLISITNNDSLDKLVNVVLWSNCGTPLLDFPVLLAPNEVKPLGLRQILLEGQLPASGPINTAVYPSCPTQLAPPPLDETERASLRARFAGQPDPQDSMCYASPQGNGQPSIGFITVDVVNDCPTVARNPAAAGYFTTGGDPGVAASDNVLTGDFFLVNDSQNSAQGFAARAVQAETDPMNRPVRSFYGKNDDRLPLSTGNKTRFLKGGAFDGGTDLLIWTESFTEDPRAPVDGACGRCLSSPLGLTTEVLMRPESGGQTASLLFVGSDSFVRRVTVGEEPLVPPYDFGSLELLTSITCPVCSPPLPPLQSYILPVYSAEGRFSAGLPATPIGDPCAGLP